MDRLFEAADRAIEDGYTIIILSDRGVDEKSAPIPALLAVAGLHHHLIRCGARTKVGIALESGEPPRSTSLLSAHRVWRPSG